MDQILGRRFHIFHRQRVSSLCTVLAQFVKTPGNKFFALVDWHVYFTSSAAESSLPLDFDIGTEANDPVAGTLARRVHAFDDGYTGPDA
jgi:hypothetical protein